MDSRFQTPSPHAPCSLDGWAKKWKNCKEGTSTVSSTFNSDQLVKSVNTAKKTLKIIEDATFERDLWWGSEFVPSTTQMSVKFRDLKEQYLRCWFAFTVL